MSFARYLPAFALVIIVNMYATSKSNFAEFMFFLITSRSRSIAWINAGYLELNIFITFINQPKLLL